MNIRGLSTGYFQSQFPPTGHRVNRLLFHLIRVRLSISTQHICFFMVTSSKLLIDPELSRSYLEHTKAQNEGVA